MFRSGRKRGQLKVRVVRGFNLAIRDVRTSDPYVVVKHNGSKLKTRVIKNNVNPEWNEDLKFSDISLFEAVKINVFDKDMFSRDDSMGDAVVDIGPLLEAADMNPDDITEDKNIVRTVTPNGINRLTTDSNVYWVDGKVIQDVIVRLNNVECGELELQLHWAKREEGGVGSSMFTSEKIRGDLKVKVVRGFNLAVRDIRNSDPYVVVQHAGSILKTSVIKKKLNPEWNENLNFSFINPSDPIKIEVFDKDVLSHDESMGDAVVDIRLLVEIAYMNPDDIPEDNIVHTVKPNDINSLVTDSDLYWADGKVVQDVILRLNNVECGELEVQLQWAKW